MLMTRLGIERIGYACAFAFFSRITDSMAWLMLRYLCDSTWDSIQSALSSDIDMDNFITFPFLTPICAMQLPFYLFT